MWKTLWISSVKNVEKILHGLLRKKYEVFLLFFVQFQQFYPRKSYENIHNLLFFVFVDNFINGLFSIF